MRHITFVLCSGIVLGAIIAPALSAQVAGARTAEQIRASYDAHHADFDYLLGDWEFTAVNRQYGTIRGVWSAVRLDDGQVLDEYRVVRGTSVQDVFRSAERLQADAVGTALNELEAEQRSPDLR